MAGAYQGAVQAKVKKLLTEGKKPKKRKGKLGSKGGYKKCQ